MSLIIRTALTREDELLAAILHEVNGELDRENIRRGGLDGSLFDDGSIPGSKLEDDSIGANHLQALVDLTKPVATALPGSPTNGEVIFFQNTAMEAQGVVWTLKYRPASTSAYEWECVGGGYLWAEVTTGENRNNAAYGDLATVGPELTNPLAGDYDVEIGAELLSPAAGGAAYMSYDIGATAALDADSILASTGATDEQFISSASRVRRKTIATASQLLRAKYRTAGVATFSKRWMRLRPVRVG